MKKRYGFTLDKNVVKTSKGKIKDVGGKMSGLIENLLIKFNRDEIKF